MTGDGPDAVRHSGSAESSGPDDGPEGSPAHSAVTVRLSDEQSLEVDKQRLEDLARATALAEGATGEISITLAGPGRMAELNQKYMGKPGPTDVLSFPIDEAPLGGPGPGAPPRMIGEVVICPEVARNQAPDSLESELDLLVVHGVLHLLGYDHGTEEGAAEMRRLEHLLAGRSGASA
jgi:probable rRNA maturation factor